MENVLVIEEVLCVLNNERAKVHSNFNQLHDEYYSTFDNRKLKMYLGKRKDEESIRLNTIDSLIRKIKKIEEVQYPIGFRHTKEIKLATLK
jgi:hypothetical protein